MKTFRASKPEFDDPEVLESEEDELDDDLEEDEDEEDQCA